MALKSINPWSDTLIQEYKELTEREIEAHVLRSREAFTVYRNLKIDQRKKLLMQAADLLKQKKEDLGRIITLEMGKLISESVAEVEKCAWVCEYYAENAGPMLRTEKVVTEAHSSYIRYEPLGTILGIMPWNFPFWQVFRFAAPTLAAGNVILLKHASNVQGCAAAIENLFLDAGFTSGVFQNLAIGSERVAGIMAYEAVKAVSLTGSEEAGKAVAMAAGSHIKKTVLELGGSNAFIVCSDADMDKAVETGVKARMQNAGQSCIAAKRFILHRDIKDIFISRFKKALEMLRPGDPLDPGTTLAPLASINQAVGVKDQVERSVAMGAKILLGGYPDKAFYPATLVTEVKPGMPLFDEEVFGPVAPVIVVDSVEEAVRLTNRSSFGLGVSLFTGDLKKAEKLVPAFDDGAVFVNTMVKSDPRLPFGGTKHSGYGRELAVNGLREFVNVKTVYVDS